MRRFPSSWDKTLSALGFRRNTKRIKRDHYLRKNRRIETLEQRAMLSGDTIYVEAENFVGSTPSLNDVDTWQVFNDIPGNVGPVHIGSGFVSTENDNDIVGYTNYVAHNARLDYSISVEETGTYYIWVRGYATNDKNDSIHLGLNGSGQTSSEQVSIANTPADRNEWHWSNSFFNKSGRPSLFIDTSTGTEHTLNLWMREDGARVDSIILTKDEFFTPPRIEETRISITSDSYVRGGVSADNTFGGGPDATATEFDSKGRALLVKTDLNDPSDNLTRQIFLQLDLSDATEASLLSAQVELALTSAATEDFTLQAYAVENEHDGSEWDEHSLTWNTRPAEVGSLPLEWSVSTGDTNTVFDATSLIKSVLEAGKTSLSIKIVSSGNTISALKFASSEHGDTTGPTLVLNQAIDPLPTESSLVVTGDRILNGQPIRLKASYPGIPDSVKFYQDVNENGVFDNSDIILGTDNTPNDGWTANLDTSQLNGVDLEGQYVNFLSVATTGSTTHIDLASVPYVPQYEVDVPIVDDAYIRDGSANADTLYGVNDILVVKNNNNGYNRASFIEVDLSDIDLEVTSALLELTIDGLSSGTMSSFDIWVEALPGVSIDENTLTWNSSPSLTGAAFSSITRLTSLNVGQRVGIDVSNVVKSALEAGHTALTFRMLGKTDNLNENINFASKEATGDNGPKLTVKYAFTPEAGLLVADPTNAENENYNAGKLSLPEAISLMKSKEYFAGFDKIAFTPALYQQLDDLSPETLLGYGVTPGDFNGDDRLDFAFQGFNDEWFVAFSETTRFLVQPTGVFTLNNELGGLKSPSASVYAETLVGDFDGDGRDEILGRSVHWQDWYTLNYDIDLQTYELANAGGSIRNANYAGNLFIGDANRDGRDDLIGSLDPSNQNATWLVTLSDDINGNIEFTYNEDWGDWFKYADYNSATKSIDADAPYTELFDIFNTVRNEVELELYAGFMKGVNATRETKSGSSWDQAALLEAELREAGFEVTGTQSTQIVLGEIEADYDQLALWLGVPQQFLATTDHDALLAILQNGVDPNASYNSGTAKFTFEHAWVETLVPTANGLEYIALDPSWNTNEVVVANFGNTSSGFNSYFEPDSFLTTLTTDTALEYYEAKLQQHLTFNYPGASLADLAPVRVNSLESDTGSPLPMGLGDGVIAVVPTLPEVQPRFEDLDTLLGNQTDLEKWTHWASVDVYYFGSRLDSPLHISLAAYSQSTLTVSHELIEGDQYATIELSSSDDGNYPAITLSANSSSGANENLVVKINQPSSLQITPQFSESFDLPTDVFRTITFIANQVSSELLERRMDDAIDASINDTSVSKEDLTPAILFASSASKIYNNQTASDSISDYTRTVITNPVAGVVVGHAGINGVEFSQINYGYSPNYFIDERYSSTTTFRDWQDGLSLDSAFIGTIDADKIEFLNTISESQRAVEQTVGAQSMSSIRALQRAAQRTLGATSTGGSVTDDAIIEIQSSASGVANFFEIYIDTDGEFHKSYLGTSFNKPGLQNKLVDYLMIEGNQEIQFVDAMDDVIYQTESTTYVTKYRANEEFWYGYGWVQLSDTSVSTTGIVLDEVLSVRSDQIVGNPIPESEMPGEVTPRIQNVAGYPVNNANGGVFQSNTDIAFPNSGVDLDFSRRYNSLSDRDIGLGVGWTHSYSDRLIIAEDNNSAGPYYADVVWVTSEGVSHTFRHDGNQYVTPSSLLGTLERTIDFYTFQDRNGNKVVFEVMDQGSTLGQGLRTPRARLVQKLDLNENGIVVNYEPTGFYWDIIDYVQDVHEHSSGVAPTARYLDFEYDGNNHLQSIEKWVSGDSSSGFPTATWEYDYHELKIGEGFSTITSQALGIVTAPTDLQVDGNGNSFISEGEIKTSYNYFNNEEGSGDAAVFHGLLKSVVQPNMDETTYDYYPNRRVFQITDGESNASSFIYDLVNNTTTAIDSLGRHTVQTFNDDALMIRQINPDRTRIETVWGVEFAGEAGHIDVDGPDGVADGIVDGTEYLQTEMVDEVGAVETFDYFLNNALPGYVERELQRSISKQFLDADGSLVSGTQEGLVSEFEYVEKTNGVVRIKESKVGAGDDERLSTYTYDTVGRLTELVDPEGGKTTYDYYKSVDLPSDRQHEVGLLESTISPRGNRDVAEDTGDDEVANIWESVQWYELESSFNVSGKTFTVSAELYSGSLGIVADAIRIDLLNVNGSVDQTYIVDNISWDGKDGLGGEPGAIDANQGAPFRVYTSSFSVWDATGKPRYGEDMVGIGANTVAEWTFNDIPNGDYRVSATWDDNARDVALYKLFDGDSSGAFVSSVEKDQDVHLNGFNAFETVFNYNAAGQITSSKVAGLTTSTATYHHAGGVITVIDATGVQTTNVYDNLGRLRETIAEGDLSTSDDNIVTHYQYDASGQLEVTTDALRREVTNDYDARGLLIKMTYADGTFVEYEYDAVGNRVSMTDELGRETRSIYDSRDRLVETTFADGATSKTRYDGRGRVSEVTNSLGNVTKMKYNASGLLIETTSPEIATHNYLGAINAGIAVEDNEPGSGYLMYSVENLYTRFSANPPFISTINGAKNSNHLIAVRHNGTNWQYNDNLAWITFTEVDGDRLLAAVDFDNDTVTSLAGSKGTIEGIRQGYVSGDLEFLADHWNELSGNDGEFTITGSYFYAGEDTITTRNKYNLFGELVETIDGEGNVTQYTYDDLGRNVKSMVLGTGSTENPIDPLEQSSHNNIRPVHVGTTAYDVEGNVVESIVYNVANNSLVVGLFLDDVRSNLASFDANNGDYQRTVLAYDNYGRQTSTTYADGSSTSIEYDAVGRVRFTENERGARSENAYDDFGRLLVIYQSDPNYDPVLDPFDDADRPSISQTYDGVGNVLTTTDPNGHTTSFVYDKRNRLVSSTNPVLSTTSTIYDEAGQVVAAVNALGIAVANKYDKRGRVVRTSWVDPDQSGNALSPFEIYKYDLAGNLEETVDVLGYKTTNEYDSLYRLVRQSMEQKYLAGSSSTQDIITSFNYDNNGQMLNSFDPHYYETSYSYDELGRVTTETLPDPDGDGPLGNYTTTTTYDGYSNVTKVETPGLSGGNQVDEFEYDLRNQLTKETINLGSSGSTQEVVNTYEYDAVGNTTTTTLAVGGTAEEVATSFEYDFLNRLISEEVKLNDGSSDQAKHTTSFTYDLAGNLESETYTLATGFNYIAHVTSVETEYQYDDANRLTTVIEDKGEINATSLTEYDAVGNILATTDATGVTTSYEYDDLFRLIKTTYADPDLSDGLPSALFETYDYDAAGNMTSMENNEGDVTVYDNDNFGRVLRETIYPDGSMPESTSYEYDERGDLTKVTDPEYNITSYDYDGWNRIITEVQGELSESSDPEKTRTYAYNQQGNLEEVIDRQGRKVTYNYDELDRLIAEKWYDTTNMVTDTLAWDYDLLGRLTNTTHTSLSEGLISQDQYDYDNLDRVIERRNYDTIGSTPENEVKQTYNYDKNPFPVGSESLHSYQYILSTYPINDSFGVPLQRDYANTTNTYDKLNRLTGISESHFTSIGQAGAPSYTIESKSISFDYDDAGRMTQANRGTGLPVSNYYYDGAGRLENLNYVTNSVTLADYNYTYDNASRTKTVSANTLYGGLSIDRDETYTYDAAGRLSLWNQTVEDTLDSENSNNPLNLDDTNNYALDGAGNRTGNTPSNSNVDYSTGDYNQLEVGDGYHYDYDKEGNLEARYIDGGDGSLGTGDTDVTRYTWDHRNRLVELTYEAVDDGIVDTFNDRVSYRYNTDDLRIRKVVENGAGNIDQIEHFIYEGSQVVAILDGSWIDNISTPDVPTNDATMQRRIINGTSIDSAIAEEVFAGTHQGELLWAITDHGRNVRGVLDNNGVLVNHIEYDDYGNILASVDAAKTTVTEQAIDAAFAGREWDADANLYYNRARWYDPGEGRFISQDPIGFSGGDINLYRYAAGDPVNYFDPSGQSWLSKWVDDVEDDIDGIIDNVNSFFSDPIDYINNYVKGTMLSLMYAVENPEEVLKAKIKDPYFWAGLVVGAHASWGFFNANLSANGLSAGFSIFNAGPPTLGVSSPLANFATRFVGAFASGNTELESYAGEGTGVVQTQYQETIYRGQGERTWGEYWGEWGTSISGAAGYVYDSGKQVVYGEYYEGEPTVGGAVGSIGASLSGADFAADIRDITHNVQHWEWTWSHVGQTALNTVGLVPVLGVVKNADEASLLWKVFRQADTGANAGGAARKLFSVNSLIGESTKLVREAQKAGRSVQKSLDHLTDELRKGNLNPGISNRSLGSRIFEARARDGARVIFRTVEDNTIEILGKTYKNEASQRTVLNEIKRLYGN